MNQKSDKSSHRPEEEVPATNQGQETPPVGQGDEMAAPKAECDALRAERDALKVERDELLSRLQHVSADYQNYQKRIQREMHESREYAASALIKELLAVLDDLDLAIEHGKTAHEETDPLMAGLLLVRDKALDILSRHGLKVIDTQGQPFDPNLHQALMQEPASDVTAPMVTRELQRGYMLKGRVIRPAKVAVAMPAEDE